MSKGIIRLKDVLQAMETAEAPFSIKYVACNKKKRSGGYIVQLDKCFKTGDQTDTPPKAAAKLSKVLAPVVGPSKNPHHYENYTRNLKVLPSGQIRKCSIWLIIEFNGMKVII